MSKKNCENCEECQGERFPSTCIELEVDSCYGTFNEFIEGVEESVSKLEEDEIEIKGLSTSTTLTKDEKIQILINEVVKLKNKLEKATLCNKLNFNNLSNCSITDNCAGFQLLIDTVADLKNCSNV